MFHCPVGVWVIEQRAIILTATVRSPTVYMIPWHRVSAVDTQSGIGNWENFWKFQLKSFNSEKFIFVIKM